MNRKTAIFCALCVANCVAWAASTTAAERFGRYHNDRFAFSVDIPADWRADPPPENGDGLSFRQPSGQGLISAFARLAQGSFAIEARDAFAERDLEAITFKRAGKDWVAVSGLRLGAIYYRRGVLGCGGEVWSEVDIEYPEAEKANYDALVTHVAASLRPGIGKNAAHCR